MASSTDAFSPAGVHEYRPGADTVVPPIEATIVGALMRTARQAPARPYLTWCCADGTTTTLTYGELERRSRRLASFLVRTHRPDSTIALLPCNDIPSVVAIFAALRAGMPCLFLNPADPVARLGTLLDAYPVAAVLSSPYAPPHVQDFVRNAAGEWTGLVLGSDDPVLSCGAVVPAVLPGDGPVPAEQAAFLFGTSGSTAASKLVVQPHRSVASNADAVRRHHRLDQNSVLMGGLPLHHVNGVHFTLMAPAAVGAHVVLPQKLAPFTYRGLVEAHRPHLASLVPPMLEMLLATGRDWRPPQSLRYFVSAAAPLSRGLLRRTVETFGIRVLQGYGLSETTNFSTTVPPDISDETYRAVALDAELPSVGVALPGNEIEVFAPDGTILEERQTGELRIRGHNVMTGYAGRPDLTAAAFAGGWFHSGDLGYWATGPDGQRYFYLTGRDKNIAKVRGESVSLEEVERALVSLDGVADAACLAVPHRIWGEQLVAVVAVPTADLPGVMAALAALMPASAVPSRWYSVDQVPRSTTGKLLRPLLAERYAPEAQHSSNVDEVSTERVESVLAQHDAIADAVVFTVNHRALGQASVAAVTVQYDVAVRDLHLYARQHLFPPEFPTIILVLPELPRDAAGSVVKQDIAELLDKPGPARYVAPRSEAERVLAGVWAEALQMGVVGVDENFFEIGGDSVAAIEIAAHVTTLTGVEIDVADIFDRSTIAELAELLGGESSQ